jgi:hypothetical protein
MKTVLALYLERLRNAEYYQFMLTVMHCFTNEQKTKYKFINRYDKLNDSKILFEAIFNSNKKAKETPEVQAADKARDTVFIGIKQIIQGFLRAGDPGQKAAAEEIMFLLEPYKNAYKASQEANSGLLHKFIADIKQDDVYNYVTMLNLNHQIDELAALNDAFDEIFYKRGESYLAAKDADNLVKIRKNMNIAYRDLMAKVNALYLIADDDDDNVVKGDIGALIDHINAIILQLSHTISRRRGINIIIKDDEGNDNGDGPIEISGEAPKE